MRVRVYRSFDNLRQLIRGGRINCLFVARLLNLLNELHCRPAATEFVLQPFAVLLVGKGIRGFSPGFQDRLTGE
jgi:hypothetical protein